MHIKPALVAVIIGLLGLMSVADGLIHHAPPCRCLPGSCETPPCAPGTTRCVCALRHGRERAELYPPQEVLAQPISGSTKCSCPPPPPCAASDPKLCPPAERCACELLKHRASFTNDKIEQWNRRALRNARAAGGRGRGGRGGRVGGRGRLSESAKLRPLKVKKPKRILPHAQDPVMGVDLEKVDDEEAARMQQRKKAKKNVKSRSMKKFIRVLKEQFAQNPRTRKEQGMLQRLLNEETEAQQLSDDERYVREKSRFRPLPSARGARVWATILKRSEDSKKKRTEIFLQGKTPEGSYSPVIGPAASGMPQRERLKRLDRKFKERKGKKKAAASSSGSGSAGATAAGSSSGNVAATDPAQRAPRRIVVHLDVTIPRRDSNMTEVRVQGSLETRQGDMPNELQAINNTLSGQLGRICVAISRPPRLLHSILFNTACGGSLGIGNSTEDIVVFDRQARAVGRNRDGFNVSASLRLTPQAAQNQELELQRCLVQARGSGKGMEAALSFAAARANVARSIPYCVANSTNPNLGMVLYVNQSTCESAEWRQQFVFFGFPEYEDKTQPLCVRMTRRKPARMFIDIGRTECSNKLWQQVALFYAYEPVDEYQIRQVAVDICYKRFGGPGRRAKSLDL